MSVRHCSYRRVGKPPAPTVAERQHSLNPVMMLTGVAHHSQNKPDAISVKDSAYELSHLSGTRTSLRSCTQGVHRGSFIGVVQCVFGCCGKQECRYGAHEVRA
jgi:hypothetical protein